MRMSYTIHQVAEGAGISVRTLHYYDEIGLLTPARVKSNGYRQYEQEELLKLQQILFFRELDFPLNEIQKILSSPTFNTQQALRDQKKLLELKRKRLNGLLKTIDKTITSIVKKTTMSDKDIYGSFNNDEMDQYTKEAKERWGNTEAYRQSQEQVKKMTKEDFARVQKENDELLLKIIAVMDKEPGSPEVLTLIAQHYNSLRTFYEPNLKLYHGLADMYISDPRFTAFYEKRHEGLAQFMHDAMIAYCSTKK